MWNHKVLVVQNQYTNALRSPLIQASSKSFQTTETVAEPVQPMINRTILVPTFQPFPNKYHELDLQRMSESDIRDLEVNDPFAYHSLPGVHKSKMLLKYVDYSSISSAPSAIFSTPLTRSSKAVQRRTRFSAEYHADAFKNPQDATDDDDFSLMSEDDAFEELVLGTSTSSDIVKDTLPFVVLERSEQHQETKCMTWP